MTEIIFRTQVGVHAVGKNNNVPCESLILLCPTYVAIFRQ